MQSIFYQMDNKDPKKSNNTKWIALVNIPIQMGIIVFAFAYLGSWLDDNHPSKTLYYNKIFVMIGVVLALLNVMRQVKQINK